MVLKNKFLNGWGLFSLITVPISFAVVVAMDNGSVQRHWRFFAAPVVGSLFGTLAVPGLRGFLDSHAAFQ